MNRARDQAMVRAVVSHDEIDTRYRRAGSGPAVVLLGLDFGFEDDESRLPDPLVPLTAHCRVFMPDLADIAALAPCGGGDAAPFSRWFRGFLEGLGLQGARVVASAALEGVLTRFLARHPGEIDRVVIVGSSAVASTRETPADPGEATLWRASADASWGDIAQFVGPAMPLAPPRTPG